MPILNLDIFPHLVMLHVKKKLTFQGKQFKESCKSSNSTLYLFICSEKNLRKVTLKQKNIPCFKVGSFGKGTAIFNPLLAEKYKA